MHWGEPILRVLALLTPKASGARRGDWPCRMTTVRSPAPTPDPPAHNCPQMLRVHSDAGTAQGLQGTRPVFISKLVLVGGGGRGMGGNRGTSGCTGWAPRMCGQEGPGLCLWTRWLGPSSADGDSL